MEDEINILRAYVTELEWQLDFAWNHEYRAGLPESARRHRYKRIRNATLMRYINGPALKTKTQAGVEHFPNICLL